MSTSPETVFRIRQWLAVIIIALVSAPHVYAYTPIPAIKAPKASKSLLVDVEKAGDRLVIVGERGHVLISDDKGKTWQQSDVPVNQMLNAVSFPDSLHGWAVGHDGHIIVTVDGGKTWNLQRNGLSAQAEMNARALQLYRTEVAQLEKLLADPALDDSTRLQLKDQLDEAEWQLGSAKERSEHSAVANPLLDVWFSDLKRGWVVGAFGLLLKTVDGGEHWQDVSKSLDNEMGYHLNAVSGLKDGSVAIAGESGFLQVSKDQGVTWKAIDLGYDGTLFALKASPSGDEIIATGLRGKTFFSNDVESDWADITPEVGFSLAGVEFIGNGQFLLVGHGGTLALSKNHGDTYTYSTHPTRTSISAAAYNGNSEFILVGQGGVRLFSLALPANNNKKEGEQHVREK